MIELKDNIVKNITNKEYQNFDFLPSYFFNVDNSIDINPRLVLRFSEVIFVIIMEGALIMN